MQTSETISCRQACHRTVRWATTRCRAGLTGRHAAGAGCRLRRRACASVLWGTRARRAAAARMATGRLGACASARSAASRQRPHWPAATHCSSLPPPPLRPPPPLPRSPPSNSTHWEGATQEAVPVAHFKHALLREPKASSVEGKTPRKYKGLPVVFCITTCTITAC
jgi:hypothetical protein